jgi:CubicO group peptidase (beta-lactamase class C family)
MISKPTNDRPDPNSHSAGLTRIAELLAEEVATDRLMGAAVHVSCAGEPLEPMVAGRRRLDDPDANVAANTIFLIASITKPLVAAAVVKLIENGEIILDDPVTRFVPEFGQNGKADVRIRHLLTHTSGLPDMIPDNRAYREAKKPLSEFIKRIFELPLAFQPGWHISYQSSGIAILGEICERVTRMALADYLNREFFQPLGLKDTALRMLDRSDRESDVKIAGEGLAFGGTGTDYDWNSDYWRGFGAPWGGVLTTVEEMTRLLLLFRSGGELDGKRILSERSVATMIEDHSSVLPDIAAADQKRQRWGLGWRLSGPTAKVFGDRVSEDTFGHSGATGTLAWVDPVNDVTCVIFTNDPAAAGALRPKISNLVASAVRD